MQNQEIIKIIENLKGRRDYEQKKAKKLGFNYWFFWFFLANLLIKNRAIAVTADQSLEKLTSSKSLEKPFKRTISRLFELTSKDIQIWDKTFIICK